MSPDLLRIKEIIPPILGIQEVSLDIQELYQGQNNARKNFDQRLNDFLNSDDRNGKIFRPQGDILVYRTECVIPTKQDSRRPLLLLLGNPASHSVKEEMFFSYERDGQEHRFWKVLDKSGIFPLLPENMNLHERNKLRKQMLSDLNYRSPFSIGLAVFYSMPSPSSGKWAGVAGLKRLFRKEAFDRITEWERKRVNEMIKEFVSHRLGLVVAFQKDAYSKIKSKDSECYSRKKTMTNGIKGKWQCNENVPLYCVAPTRNMQTNLHLLKEIVDSATDQH
jgi:hypothetical protein